MTYKIHQGDNRQILKTLADNSIDAIVTDPPYGIDFLGKSWDANTGALETYQECLRVLKPGGHILAFSAARTYHHLAITLEQAGFEIRDQIMWIYSSGFPKSQDVGRSIQRSLGVKETKAIQNTTLRSKQKLLDHNGITENIYANGAEQVVVTDPEALQWEGWGTQLKPAHEPIALARKPLKQSIAKNCQQWGTGAINIDATRVGKPISYTSKCAFSNNSSLETENETVSDFEEDVTVAGRFPSNVLGEILQADYQKYFYCPKVSREERHLGFDTNDIPTNPDGMWDDGVQFQEKKQDISTEASMLADMGGYYVDNNGIKQELTGKQVWLPQTGNIYVHGLKEEYRKWCEANGKTPNVGNNHPTVKPVELMKYLIKLITPPGGTVLDPFNGSGTTGMAATELGFDYIGCELDPKYVEISIKRIEAWRNRDYNAEVFDSLFTFQ